MTEATPEVVEVTLEDFTKAYVKASKSGTVTAGELQEQLDITEEQYNGFRNSLSKIAKANQIELKPLKRKERSANLSTQKIAELLKGMLEEQHYVV